MSAPPPTSSKPVARATGGGVFWVGDGDIPEMRRVAPGRVAAGHNWLGLRANGDYVVTGFSETPLLPGIAALCPGASACLLAAVAPRGAVRRSPVRLLVRHRGRGARGLRREASAGVTGLFGSADDASRRRAVARSIDPALARRSPAGCGEQGAYASVSAMLRTDPRADPSRRLEIHRRGGAGDAHPVPPLARRSAGPR